MDGFVAQQEGARDACLDRFNPACASVSVRHDVIGYHDGQDIPNYWAYASRFVLQDHMFESVASWSVPAHLYLVSGWSAVCTNSFDPMSCRSNLRTPDVEAILGAADSYAEAVHDEHAGHDRLMEAAREARDYRKQAVRWGR